MADTTVTVTNLTDVPGPKKLRPEVIDLFNQSLSPGEVLRIPQSYVHDRLHRMANETGKICVGPLPAWYQQAKTRKGKTLTQADAIARLQTPSPDASDISGVKPIPNASSHDDTNDRTTVPARKKHRG